MNDCEDKNRMNKIKKKYYEYLYEPLPRWSSYWYQIHEVMQLKPKIVLEIGVGNKVVSNYLKECGLNIATMDIDRSLAPNIVASVINIPKPADSFDVVLAAEVLEHLPYKEFVPALCEIQRVTKRYAVISLPHWGRIFSLILKIPALPWMRFLWKMPGFKRHFKGKNGHFWEIGKRGFSLSRIKKDISIAGFDIINDYIILEYPYHHFFVLRKQIR